MRYDEQYDDQDWEYERERSREERPQYEYDDYDEDEIEEEMARRKAIRMERRKRKKRKRLVQRIMIWGTAAVIICSVAGTFIYRDHQRNLQEAAQDRAQMQAAEEAAAQEAAAADSTEEETVEEGPVALQSTENEATVQMNEELDSTTAVLFSVKDGSIIAEKGNPNARIVPASMTKILTVLVAKEHVENLDDTFEITYTETDYSFKNECSIVGFSVGEKPTIRDLFYGTILCSGADAAMGLADYTAGSQEAFVEWMNAKLQDLGIADSAHFTNCVGVYEEDLYCTPYDMAVILNEVMKDDFLREVMSAHTYTTSSTTEHPEGILISNWFLRRIEDKDSGSGFVLGAKTGYVAQSGNCAASYATDPEGNGYICVTAAATSGWRCIYDHAAIYKRFIPGDGSGTADAETGDSADTADGSTGETQTGDETAGEEGDNFE